MSAPLVVRNVKSFLSRQPCQGILVSLPGQWDAWFWLDTMWTESVYVLGPAESTWASWRTVPDLMRQCILREQATTPRLPNSIRYLMDISVATMAIWQALDEVMQQHERWSRARRTWLKSVVQ